MKEQKNIERLFQEKLKSFEATPPLDSWKTIENKLVDKKSNRKVIPFWIKLAGIAAMLIISFTFLNETLKSNNSDSNSKEINPIVLDEKQELNKENIKVENSNNNIVNQITNENNFKTKKTNYLNSNTKQTKDSKLETKFFQENLVSTLTLTNTIEKDNFLEKYSTTINSNKNNKDSLLIVQTTKEVNQLEKLLEEKKDGKNADEKEKLKRNKWGVSAMATPVYFNSLTNGSTLDNIFLDNNKEYSTNISNGLGISYSINNRISIKTGVHNHQFNITTNDILYYQDVSINEIQNLSRNEMGSVLNLESKNLDNKTYLTLSNSTVEKFEGNLRQEMGYIEVPLEISYKVLSNKFSIDFVGGMSSFFLNKNNVSIISNNNTLNIGKANNLNAFHFSSNVGVGFNYSFFKSMKASLQPMFKYQFNTFSNDVGNFKPYIIGIYSGISYNF